jgi:hypothetical protein
MDSKKIKALLEKYWSCDTSLEEEQLLKDYFLSKETDENFSDSAILFQYYDQEKKKQAEDILSDKEILDLVQKSESDRVTIKETDKKDRHYLPWYGTMSKIAAVLVVGLIVTFFVYRDQIKEDTVATILQTDTYEDTQKAYEETMKALALISKQLNAGRQQTMKFAKFSEAEEVIKESIAN